MRTYLLIGLGLLSFAAHAPAQEAVRLREAFAPGYHYHVSGRVDLSGSLALPPDKDQKGPQSLAVTGSSALEYDERVLAEANNVVSRSIRQYRRMDFQRKVGS